MQNTKSRHLSVNTPRAGDWTAQFLGRMIWWVIPALIAVLASSFNFSTERTGFIFAGVFFWAGTGCLLNARRCGRLHCFFSGPALWIGAIAAMLVGLRIFSGAHALNDVVFGTVSLVLASRVPEVIWGKYIRGARSAPVAGR